MRCKCRTRNCNSCVRYVELLLPSGAGLPVACDDVKPVILHTIFSLRISDELQRQLAATSDDEASRANAVAMLGCVAQLQSHRSNLADVAKILLHAATKDMSWG